MIIRYEDLLKDLSKVLEDVRNRFGLIKKDDVYQNISKVFKSKRFSTSRLKYYKKGKFTEQFSKDELLVLKHNLSKEVVEDFGYEW